MPRLRPITLVVLGLLAAAGLAAAGRAGRERHETDPVFSPPPSPPERPTAPSSPSAREARRPRRVGHLAWAFAAAALLLAGAAWSGQGPHIERLSAAAEARTKAESAEASRLALLGKLQLAGIAARRAGPVLAPSPRPRTAAVSSDARELALARYASAVGSDAIAQVVAGSASALAQRVLDDSRIDIYPGGRTDVASGRVDPRVLALLIYLAEAHGQVSVSCLISGHSYFVHQSAADQKSKRPRVVSAHVSGRAVDISALGGIPIYGNQQPGGVTDRAIEEILSLPTALQPRQVISLLDLSGPSFRLPDHADHIHVGF